MSGSTITVDASTTVAQLHEQVYNANISDYANVYADLIDQNPDFVKIIQEALTFSANFALQQEGFIDFINQEIAALYADIAENSYPADVDIDEIGTIFPEL